MPAELDPTIAALTADLPAPASPFANVPQLERAMWWISAICALALADMTAPRVFTGYQGKAARTETRARAYSAGLLTPPARETAADRHAAEVARWYS